MLVKIHVITDVDSFSFLIFYRFYCNRVIERRQTVYYSYNTKIVYWNRCDVHDPLAGVTVRIENTRNTNDFRSNTQTR